MSRDVEKTAVEKYWPAALLLVPVLLYFMINGFGGGDDDGDGTSNPISVNVKQVSEGDLDPVLMNAKPKMRKTAQEINQETIAQHEAQLNDPNISTEDRQALLMATANLYMVKMNDCEKASSYYLQFIDDYPDSRKLSQAYLQLLTCYETMNDEANARALLRKMKDAFPADSPEHQLAAQKLDKGELDPPTRQIPQGQ